ncbi:MAG: membrane protein insertase YidC [Thermoflexales bacterium]|nr:membrane protein insertase YidC [Thermoflexales bacterium]
MQPFINALLLIYHYLGNNFTIAIIVFTVVLRVILYPLTIQQQQQSKAMQALQPQIQDLQKKYGKDKEKFAAAQMELYKQVGFNPMGGCLPMLIQFPIMIGMYQSITRVMAVNPLQLFDLSKHLYPFLPQLALLLPLNNRLDIGPIQWLDLGQPDPYYILPVLVGITTFLQQKLMTPPTSGNDQSAAMNKQMMIMMPLMFGYFTAFWASGLGIYFVVSNLIGIAQYWLIGNQTVGASAAQPYLPTPTSSGSGETGDKSAQSAPKAAAARPKRRRRKS